MQRVMKIKEPLEYPLVVDTVLASLLNPDANVSAAALDTLRKVKGVEKRAGFPRRHGTSCRTPTIRVSS